MGIYRVTKILKFLEQLFHPGQLIKLTDEQLAKVKDSVEELDKVTKVIQFKKTKNVNTATTKRR